MKRNFGQIILHSVEQPISFVCVLVSVCVCVCVLCGYFSQTGAFDMLETMDDTVSIWREIFTVHIKIDAMILLRHCWNSFFFCFFSTLRGFECLCICFSLFNPQILFFSQYVGVKNVYDLFSLNQIILTIMYILVVLFVWMSSLYYSLSLSENLLLMRFYLKP